MVPFSSESSRNIRWATATTPPIVTFSLVSLLSNKEFTRPTCWKPTYRTDPQCWQTCEVPSLPSLTSILSVLGLFKYASALLACTFTSFVELSVMSNVSVSPKTLVTMGVAGKLNIGRTHISPMKMKSGR
eukprot:5035846-Amphidinium_carterae.3